MSNIDTWNLKDFYADHNDPKIQHDITLLQHLVQSFVSKYKDTITGARDILEESLAAYEDIEAVAGKLQSYAFLLRAINLDNPEINTFYQNTMEAVMTLSSKILFYTIAINNIPDDMLKQAIASSDKLPHYSNWFYQVRMMRPYQLSEELERFSAEKDVTGRGAWIKLFDDFIASLRFEFKGEKLTESEIFHYLSSESGEERKDAAVVIADVFGKNIKMFATITNTLAKDKSINDEFRKLPRPISDRNLANCIEDDVVDLMLGVVKSNYANISHRYYKIKSKAFGCERLDYWDRNAPYPGAQRPTYEWKEAQKLTLDAYREFSAKLADIGERFFDCGKIDIYPRAGKMSGAFAHPTVPDVHPYIMLNYQGTARDVMTLAHELGHGVHQVLAGKAQGPIMSSTPLTFAETASVFGEQLVFEHMVKTTENPAQKAVLLAGKIEDSIATIFRQCAFCEFEVAIHDARKKGELSVEEIGNIWMTTQRESLGDHVALSDNYKYLWSYIPHFIHSPFYVYSYAFGNCLVNSLYMSYKNKPNGFVDRYIDLLAAGGSKGHVELLKPFDLDIRERSFWDGGLKFLSDMLDEFEKVVEMISR